MKNIIYLIVFILLSSLVLAAQGNQTLNIQITADPDTGSAPLHVNFATSPPNQIQQYAWDFDDNGVVDSTQPNPSYTYTTPGSYLVRLNAVDQNNEAAEVTKAIVVKSQITVSMTANPSSGTAPLKVQFTAAAAGQGTLTYDWDFNNDGVIDSTTQSPDTTYTKEGNYVAKLTVIDETGNSVSKNMTITITKFDSGLKLNSYFPSSLNMGENELTFIVQNNGAETLSDIDARIVGNGITSLTSSKIDSLNPGDQDSMTVKIRISQAGTLSATAKILDKSFPVTFTVSQGTQYNSTQLQADITALRDTSQKYETDLANKKASGYIVDTAAENIRSAKSYLQKAQEDVLQNDLRDAKVNIDLASSNLEDARVSLLSAQKLKITFLQFMKENALAITAIIAALGTLGAIFAKLFGHAKKFGEKMSTVVKTHKFDVVKKGKKKEKPLKKKEEHKPIVPDENKQE